MREYAFILIIDNFAIQQTDIVKILDNFCQCLSTIERSHIIILRDFLNDPDT